MCLSSIHVLTRCAEMCWHSLVARFSDYVALIIVFGLSAHQTAIVCQTIVLCNSRNSTDLVAVIWTPPWPLTNYFCFNLRLAVLI